MSELVATEIWDRVDAMLADPKDWVAKFRDAWPKNYFSIGATCRAIRVNTRTFNGRLKSDAAFGHFFEELREEARDVVRQELMRRALEPSERPVYHKGELVDTILEYDNRHLEWLAERLMPEEYHLPLRVEFARPDDADFVFAMGEVHPKPLELPAGDVQDSDDEPAG